jgi:hypothetical protein
MTKQVAVVVEALLVREAHQLATTQAARLDWVGVLQEVQAMGLLMVQCLAAVAEEVL